MRNDIFSKSVKNRGFSQNSKGGTKANFAKMADFLGKLWKLRKIPRFFTQTFLHSTNL